MDALAVPERGLRLLVASPEASLYEVSTWRERGAVDAPTTDVGG
jgi:hypothetical protein